jgi:acetyltransferase-like isoleucine patch superfamily enzyme
MGFGSLRRSANHLVISSMANIKIKLRPFLRPIVRWAKYFSYNTHFIDGDKKLVSIGTRCGLANTLFNTASGLIVVGDNCAFGYNVMLLTGRHNFVDGVRASLSNPKDSEWGGGGIEVPSSGRDIVIGSGCWIASGVIISGGVTIGNNCIIAAGSVVIQSIPAGSIAAGIPSRIVGSTQT